MTTPPIIEVRAVDTAEELFHNLSPVTGPMWQGGSDYNNPGRWVFRGHANGEDGTMWNLLPSAFRPGAFLKYMIAVVADRPATSGKDQRALELDAVLNFAAMVDREGMLVPGDDPELRDTRVAAANITPLGHREFPPARLGAMFALAQHYGVPTRLLDWTWKSLVAVYFAAEPVARRREPGRAPPANEPPFSVFALRRIIQDSAFALEPGIHLLTVPTATNANLHAQGGLFSLVQLLDQDEHPLPDLATVLERHADRIATRHDGAHLHLFPFLIEYRVPAREARTVMKLLAEMGVTAASIYPGLGGAARAVTERRIYQWADPGERS